MRIFFGLVLTCAVATAQAAPLDEGKAAFAAGKAAFDRGDFPTALAEFQRANAIAPAPTLFYNIGVTYERMGRYRDAADAFERYLREAGSPQTDEEQRLYEDVRARAAADRNRPDAPAYAQPAYTQPAYTQPAYAAPPPIVEPPAVTAPLPSPKRSYPASIVERPLILPPLMFQPALLLDISNSDSGGTGEVLGLSLDMGLARRLQAGFFFSFPVDPNADFGTFVANLQLGLADLVNLRFDIGVERISFASSGSFGSRSTSVDGFLFGLGLPWKARLHRMFAVVGGAANAPGFGTQPMIVDKAGKTSVYGGGLLTSNDLLVLTVYDYTNVVGPSFGTMLFGTFHIPIGVVIQPHDRISFGLRTGYRLSFNKCDGSACPGSPAITHWIPFSFDLVVNIIRQIDFGFTATLLGFVDSSNTPSLKVDWADLRQFSLYVNGRF
jgi:hypothetical protein